MKNVLFSIVIFMILIGNFIMSKALAESVGKTYVVKVATLAPEGTDWIVVANMIKKYIEEKSNGRAKVLIYAGGVMGDDPDVIRKMRLGQIQLAGFSGHGTHLAAPEIAILELPYIVDSESKVEALYKGMGKDFDGFFDKNGFKLLYLVREGYNQFYAQIPLLTPDDIKKVKTHTWAGKVEEETLKALGSRPAAIGAVESVPSLRSGIINAHFSPALWELGTQLFTVDKYINLPNMRYHSASLVMTKSAWHKYPKWLRDLAEEACLKYGPVLYERAKEGEKKSLKAFQEYGMELVNLTPEQENVFRRLTLPLWEKLAGDLYPKDALYHALSILKNLE